MHVFLSLFYKSRQISSLSMQMHTTIFNRPSLIAMTRTIENDGASTMMWVVADHVDADVGYIRRSSPQPLHALTTAMDHSNTIHPGAIFGTLIRSAPGLLSRDVGATYPSKLHDWRPRAMGMDPATPPDEPIEHRNRLI